MPDVHGGRRVPGPVDVQRQVDANLAAGDGNEFLPPRQEGESGPHLKGLFADGILDGPHGKGLGAGSALGQIYFKDFVRPVSQNLLLPSPSTDRQSLPLRQRPPSHFVVSLIFVSLVLHYTAQTKDVQRIELALAAVPPGSKEHKGNC